jgi:hypothetical protein
MAYDNLFEALGTAQLYIERYKREFPGAYSYLSPQIELASENIAAVLQMLHGLHEARKLVTPAPRH